MYEVQGNRILKDGQVVNQQRDSYSDAFKQHYDLVNQYADSPYASLFENNAYANLQYHPSFIDDLASIFGSDSSAYSSWLNERDSNLAAEDAKVLASIQANQYNSPAEQSARMRAAGLNPDILGTGDVASASEVAPDETPISGKTAGIDEVFPFVSMIAQGLMSAISSGFQIYQSMSSLDADLDTKAIGNYSGIINLAKAFVNQSTPSVEPGIKFDDYINSQMDISRFRNLSNEQVSDFMRSAFGYTFRSRHNKSAFGNAVLNYMTSNDYREYLTSKYKGNMDNLVDVARMQSQPYWSPFLDEMTKAFKPLTKVMFDSQLKQLNAALAKSNFDYNYWISRSGSDSGFYDQNIHRNSYLQSEYKTENDFMDKELKKVEYQFTSAYRQMINTLYQDANNGNTAAQSILMGLFTGRGLFDRVFAAFGVSPAGKVTKSIGIK